MVALIFLVQLCKSIDPIAEPPSRAMPIHDRIVERLAARIFSDPLIQNEYRGDDVEEMVALALEPDWTLCSGAWAGWDLRHRSRLRMQSKQSAARHGWAGEPYVGSFGIAPAKGYWIDGIKWVELVGRPAAHYVFAGHPRTDGAHDYRDPQQWRFFVVKDRGLRRDNQGQSPSSHPECRATKDVARCPVFQSGVKAGMSKNVRRQRNWDR